jgi:hypothetical protein
MKMNDSEEHIDSPLGSVPLSSLWSDGMSPSLISLKSRTSAAHLSNVACGIEPTGSSRIRTCARDAKAC